jgi:hypothetical protein
MKVISTLLIASVTGTPLVAVHLPPGTWAGFPAAVDRHRSQVEFYDRRYNHTLYGQFTGGRYGVPTLLLSDQGRGLALNGDERDWMISAAEFARVRIWLRGIR